MSESQTRAIVRITIDVEIEPDVDASAMQIASAVVLSAFHEASLFPHRLVIEEPASASSQDRS